MGSSRENKSQQRACGTNSLRKIIWMSKRSKFHMAYNALESEIGVDDETEIMLFPAVTASGIKSVSELRELIKSPTMYKNEVVFNLFCLGLERHAQIG
jgi:hypothetical protein